MPAMEHIILLHGALGSKNLMLPLAYTLEDKYRVHAFNFSGHGGRPFSTEPFSIPFFTNQILQYMQEQDIAQAHLFGYSMGGYAAMYLAKLYPEKVGKIITLATKFHWDEAIGAKEVKMLDHEKIQEKLPAFAEELKRRHAPNKWIDVIEKIKELLTGLGKQNTLQPEDYASINTPGLLLLGDRDKMVTLEETVAIYKQLPAGQLGMLPGTPHPYEQVNVKLLAFLIHEFLEKP
jgi:pimeloyl-ACP methyl ester carboxylesterase